MIARLFLFLALHCVAVRGARAQGYLGATERLEVSAGGSVMPNMLLLSDGANDFEFSAGYFHCISPQWEIGASVGNSALTVASEKSSKAEQLTNVRGLLVTGEARYYLRNWAHSTAPMGYYIRPCFQYQALSGEEAKHETLRSETNQDSIVTHTYTVDGSAMILGFGFGRQTFFGEHFSLDWTLTTGIPLSLNVDGTMDRERVSKELSRTRIFGVRFGIGYQF